MEVFTFMCLCVGVVNALTTTERDTVLNAHNKLRSDLANGRAINANGTALPTGRNIFKLATDVSIESMAQNYANKCVFQHSTAAERNNTGENLYAYYAQQNFAEALTAASNMWWDELKEDGFYDANLILTQTEWNRGIGHWSQQAWAKTNRIGCGVQWCPTQGFTIVVCNYSPAGNYLNQAVYERGSPCSSCGTGASCDSASGLCCDASNSQCSSPVGTVTTTLSPGVTATTKAPTITTKVPTTTTKAPSSGSCTAQLTSCSSSSCGCSCTINGGTNTDTTNSSCKVSVTSCSSNSCGCSCSVTSG
ncbi:cysteine-rich secretory protein family domain-containing protein [Ditylenchus destructor]|nr:cysteine-rich secretory protein family domain-containing protein [Ditylenchus destructor]